MATIAITMDTIFKANSNAVIGISAAYTELITVKKLQYLGKIL